MEIQEVESPLVGFKIRGTTRALIELDVFGAQVEMDRMYEAELEAASKLPEGEELKRTCLDAFRVYLRDLNYPPANEDPYTRGELDQLWHAIAVAYRKKKAAQKLALDETLPSQDSTI